MAATTEKLAPVATTKGSLSSGTVAVRTADLVIGRRLQFPVYDSAGILLLAQGAVITPRFKELLKRRELDEIQASEADASELTRPEPESLEDCLVGLSEIGLTSELAARLDSTISDGGMFVKNTGPAVSKQLVLHGCKGYDVKKRAELEERHHASAKALDGMMKYALTGKRECSSNISRMASMYLTAMTEDCDLLMAIASQAGDDATISQHCLQMSTIGMAIAVELEMDADNVQTVGMCGLIHDWGMMKVPESIRSSPHLLSRSEFVAIQKHPIYALEMLENINGITGVIPLVCYQVHERPDGSGYPRGRNGRQIHQFARILNVADAYASLITPKPYRSALMPHAAIECLLALSAEGKVDSDVVQKLLLALTLYPVGSLIELSDGSVAQSLRRNGMKFSQPIVRIIRTADGKKAAADDDSLIIDLSASELRVARALPFPGREEADLTTAIVEQRRS